MRKKWTSWIGLGLVLLCSAFFVRQVVQLLSTGGIDVRSSLHLLPLAVLAYLAAYLTFGFSWHQLLAAAGRRTEFAVDLGIFTTSQFAKYLPGNIGHHAGRVFLSAKYGYPTYLVIVTMVVELALVLGAMAVLSLPSLGYWIKRLGVDATAITYALLAGGIAVITLITIAVKHRHHPKLEKVMKAFHEVSSRKAHSTFRLLLAFLGIAAGITLTTVSLGLLGEDMALLSASLFPALLGVFAASWLLGFLVPGAPAGIGIRELVLTEGLAPLIGRDQAVLIALLFRILSTAADLLAFAIGSGILWHSKRKGVTKSRLS